MSEQGVWRTMPNGNKVFIKDGQSVSEAFEEAQNIADGYVRKYDDGEWGKKRIVSGKVIFIEKGQTLSEALAESNKIRSHFLRGVEIKDNDKPNLVKEKELKPFEAMDSSEAAQTIQDRFGIDKLQEWFDKSNHKAKLELAEIIAADETLRRAGHSWHWQQYKTFLSSQLELKPLPFDKFMETDLTLFRGTGRDKDRNENAKAVLSYTMNFDTASFFSDYNRPIGQQGGRQVEAITVKPKDILGAFNNDGEWEVWIRQGKW